MSKGYCEKKKKECNEKCFCAYEYKKQVVPLPCKYLISENKGYYDYDSLKEIKGKRMRKQWFFSMVIYVLCISMFLLYYDFVMNVILKINLGTSMQQELIVLWNIFYKLEVPLLLLSLLNTKFWGKIVAVVTEQGVYTNQFFLKWEEITQIKFHPPELPSRTHFDYSYTEVISSKGTYNVAHMPLLFLFVAKKHNVNTKFEFEKWWFVIIIIFAILPFILNFIES